MRFRLLAEDILVDQERLNRRFKIWERARQLNPVETQSVAKLQGLLERGVQVLHHELSGKIVEAVLRYSSVSNDLQLFSRHEGIFMSKESVMVSTILHVSVLCHCNQEFGWELFKVNKLFCTPIFVLQAINISDISELRPGSHSLAFVRSGSTANDKEVSPFLLFLIS